jgi:hypothetical protein
MAQIFLAGFIGFVSLLLASCDSQVPEASREQEPVVTSNVPTPHDEQHSARPSEGDGAPPVNKDEQQGTTQFTPEQPNTGSTDTSEHDTYPSEDNAFVQMKQIYDSEIRAIVNSRCQMCHGSMIELNFSSFERVRADAAQMADAVANGRMPYDPELLPREEREKLLVFLDRLMQ